MPQIFIESPIPQPYGKISVPEGFVRTSQGGIYSQKRQNSRSNDEFAADRFIFQEVLCDFRETGRVQIFCEV